MAVGDIVDSVETLARHQGDTLPRGVNSPHHVDPRAEPHLLVDRVVVVVLPGVDSDHAVLVTVLPVVAEAGAASIAVVPVVVAVVPHHLAGDELPEQSKPMSGLFIFLSYSPSFTHYIFQTKNCTTFFSGH